MEPTGAPRPLERQNMTVSKPRGELGDGDAEGGGGVEDAGAVEVDGEAGFVRLRPRSLRGWAAG